MPATVIVGLQWGDEGKGKATDFLSEQVRWVVRYQGGATAGHIGSDAQMPHCSSRRPALSWYQTGYPSVGLTGPTAASPGPLIPAGPTAARATPLPAVRATAVRRTTDFRFMIPSFVEV